MQILNIAGYKFLPLKELEALRQHLLSQCNSLKGTILLSDEGININLAGTEDEIRFFQACLKKDTRFNDITFRESYSATQPFNHLKIKLKKEIITLRQPEVNPTGTRAPSIDPKVFKQWLDEKRDITVLDTRNDYEIRFGAFTGALNLHLENFGDFPSATETLNKDKTIVMYCTGGIRCEKAALYLMNQGFSDVYQLDGGILNYFAKVGGAHYEGECFVFDERISLDPELKTNGTRQCIHCQGPMKIGQHLPIATHEPACPTCAA